MKTNFRTIHPIDFQLIDKDSQNVLYIEDSSDQTLTLELSNASPNTIEFEDFTEDVSASNYHFALRFRPGTLSPSSLGINGATPIQLAANSATVWEMAPPEQDATGMDVLYLKKSSNTSETWQSDTLQTVVFEHVGADARQGARGTRVELLTKHIHFSDATENNLETQREIHLSIINHRGKKDIPLHVGFMGDNGVLNDGNTPNTLRIRCSNTLPFDATNPDATGLRFLHSDEETQRSKIILSFDADQEGGLGTVDNIGNIIIKQPTGWSIEKETQGASPEWILYPESEDQILYDRGHNDNNFLDITISDIITHFPTGHTHLYIRYENIPGYWDGQLTLPIEKRPLIYHSKEEPENSGTYFHNVGIGTSSPNDILDVHGQGTAIRVTDNDVAGRFFGSSSTKKVYVGSVTDHPLVLRTDDRDRITVATDGNVGIGTTSPTGRLNVVGSNGLSQGIQIDNQEIKFRGDGHQHFSIFNNKTLDYFTIENTSSLSQTGVSGDILLAVHKYGNVGIGTTSPSAKLEVRGNIRLSNSSTNFLNLNYDQPNGRFEVQMDTNSSSHGRANSNYHNKVVWNGDNNWDFLSDKRLKKNISKVEDILDRLVQLQVVNYNWIYSDDNEPKMTGFVAQDVQPLFPALVGETSNPNSKETTLTLKYNNFGVLAVGAIKELKAATDTAIAQQNKLIEKLTKRIQKLEEQLKR